MKNILQIIAVATFLILVSFTPKNKKTVILDVGHGGTDRGSIHNELSEKDIVLSIAKKVQDLNKDKQLNLNLTRDIDHFVSLNNRVNLANEKAADLLLSLHANYTGKTDVSGFEIFIKENALTEESLALAKAIETTYPDQIKKRKVTVANFTVLKNSECPSALLELGFMSNESDRNYLTSEDGQWEIAQAIYRAIK
jgi:N-acetylmuramoyl-L-alanine amidase